VRVLAISGSLRTRSSNRALLSAAATLAPAGMEWDTYEGLAGLPHFSPDDDEDGRPVPPAVAELRRRVIAAEGWIISSPEYAHGVPGSLKNALDWLVSCPELPG
jgi:NAD(P)H-dependent FMN reductase